ncbi:MAG: hypothetical protein ABI478_00295 [Propionivibrio sp.]
MSSLKNNDVDTPVVAKRSDDPTAIGGFTRFRSLGGPRGNPAIAGNADAYGISEAWFRRPGDATVVRAQSHAASRQGTTDSLASAWSMRAQDATGNWGAVFAAGSANNGNEVDDSAAGSLTTPQLMTVGNANLQMFACAGSRTEDNTGRSTWLIEVFPPNVAANASGRRITFVQDMLYGDDHFLPNAPGPLIGPAHPPTPNVHGPGDQLRNGHAQCAMTQLDDDVTTRELHMIVVDGGHLYHSMANGFGPSLDDHGDNVGNRFSMISPWADVSTALGANFGNIESATLVARPTAVSVIFEAESAGRHRLWHAVRFSANGGSWRPADDVTAASGASLTGLVESWNIAAGFCPNFEKTLNAPDELDYITWNNTSTFFGRIVSTPRNWAPSISGIYSPTTRINGILVAPNEPNRHNVVQTPSLFMRPF